MSVVSLVGVHKSYGTWPVLQGVDLMVPDGARIGVIGPNGAGKSTLMRMLSGVEAPDAGTRTEGHQVVMQYFAQDEATRLDPALTVYQTLAGDAPMHMVPSIRNILGGFLFSGDDVDKPVRVLSGGERTRLAVARMLLRPSNTLLLDEPTNHLDLDSKDVLLEALEDFGGTLIFVSHDRYFVDKLATKVINIGGGEALMYPGTYEEFLWSRKQREATDVPAAPRRAAAVVHAQPPAPAKPAKGQRPAAAAATVRGGAHVAEPRVAAHGATNAIGAQGSSQPVRPAIREVAAQPAAPTSYDERKKQEAEARKVRKALDARRKRIDDLELRIADREQAIKDIETTMAAPGFYDNHETAKPVIDKHQALMWEVGDLMHQWEELQQTDL
jgi:ATP-binding cassette, subfamily F, member 3